MNYKQLKTFIKEQIQQIMNEEEENKKSSVKKALMATWESLIELYQTYSENNLLDEANKVREFMNWLEHEIQKHPAKKVTWNDYE